MRSQWCMRHAGRGSRFARGWVGLALLGVTLTASAQDVLRVRLVHATNDGPPGVSADLRDVTGLLERNLPFRRFELLETRQVRLPVSETVLFGAGLAVRLEGDEGRLSVTVESGGAVLLQTQVSLRGRLPVILGGFSAPGGRRLLVLTMR